MLNARWKLIVTSSSAAILVAALGTQTLGASAQSQVCRDLQGDITAIRLALGALDGKVDQSNADLAFVRGELQLIREALLAQSTGNGGLQLQVEADVTSCGSGAVQCASAVTPTSINQIPVELKLFVLRDQMSVTDLEIGDFDITTVFWPEGGSDVTACAASETGCGSPEFFINRGNGAYQLWVHPPASLWLSGTYTLLLRVTDTGGRIARKLVNVSIGPGSAGIPGVPPPPIGDLPGTDEMRQKNSVTTVD